MHHRGGSSCTQIPQSTPFAHWPFPFLTSFREHMACSRAAVVATVLLACLLLAALPVTESRIYCGQVLSYVYPCIPYDRGLGGSVPATCCAGIRRLIRAARTTADRRTVGRCLKSAQGVARVKTGLIKGLLRRCGIIHSFDISTSIRCSRVP